MENKTEKKMKFDDFNVYFLTNEKNYSFSHIKKGGVIKRAQIKPTETKIEYVGEKENLYKRLVELRKYIKREKQKLEKKFINGVDPSNIFLMVEYSKVLGVEIAIENYIQQQNTKN